VTRRGAARQVCRVTAEAALTKLQTELARLRDFDQARPGPHPPPPLPVTSGRMAPPSAGRAVTPRTRRARKRAIPPARGGRAALPRGGGTPGAFHGRPAGWPCGKAGPCSNDTPRVRAPARHGRADSDDEGCVTAFR
jgi:hypothetical protein